MYKNRDAIFQILLSMFEGYGGIVGQFAGYYVALLLSCAYYY
jgi:hypothetical protein